jgi:hypothetical protein
MSCKIGVPISAAKMGTIMIIAEGSILVVPHSVSFASDSYLVSVY